MKSQREREFDKLEEMPADAIRAPGLCDVYAHIARTLEPRLLSCVSPDLLKFSLQGRVSLPLPASAIGVWGQPCVVMRCDTAGFLSSSHTSPARACQLGQVGLECQGVQGTVGPARELSTVL